jgi:hypothetical protein
LQDIGLPEQVKYASAGQQDIGAAQLRQAALFLFQKA